MSRPNIEYTVPDLLAALTLRNEDELSWPTIAKVMARYHDAHHTPESWRNRIAIVGEPRKHPRGRPYEVKR
jgi:hypothetical protein